MKKSQKNVKSLMYQKLDQFRNHLSKVVSESLRPEGPRVRDQLGDRNRLLTALLNSRRRMCSSYTLESRKSDALESVHG